MKQTLKETGWPLCLLYALPTVLQINVLKTAGQNGSQIFSMSANCCHKYRFIDQTLGSAENIENDGSSPQKEMVFCVTFQASSMWISTDNLWIDDTSHKLSKKSMCVYYWRVKGIFASSQQVVPFLWNTVVSCFPAPILKTALGKPDLTSAVAVTACVNRLRSCGADNETRFALGLILQCIKDSQFH